MGLILGTKFKRFNSLSRPLQCKGYDTWSHNKSKCLSEGAQRNSEYNCKTCKPASAQTKVVKHSQNEPLKFTKENDKLKCNTCDNSSKAKFNIKQHIENKHGEQGGEEVNAHVINEDIAPIEEIEVDVVEAVRNQSPTKPTLKELLEENNLGHLEKLLEDQKIDLKILMEMTKGELVGINIKEFGDRHKFFLFAQEQKKKSEQEITKKS